MELQKLKLSSVIESKTNPREDFDKAYLTSLAADIKLRGLLQPILVRKAGKSFEIIIGACRFRAHGLAELDTIDAIVVEMEDQAAEEAQLVENEKRKNLSALEHAKGYANYLARHKVTKDELALKIGISRSALYATLRLNTLLPEGKKALTDKRIPVETAKVLARVHVSRQAEAIKDVVGGRYPGDPPMSFRQALVHVQNNFMLNLSDAPFDVKDAGLHAEAGACASCEKRTGAQPDLPFDGAELAPDLCTDSNCWAVKLRLTVAADAAKRGLELLDAKEVAKVFSKFGDLQGTEYTTARAIHPGSSTGQEYGELLTPAQKKELMVVAVDPRGHVVELLRNDGLKAAVEEAGRLKKRKTPAAKSGSSAKKSSAGLTPEQRAKEAAAAEKQKADEEIQAKLAPALVCALVAAVEQRGLDRKVLALVARQAIVNTETVLERRKLKGRAWELDGAKAFDKLFGKLTPAQLVGLIFESVYDQDFSDATDGGGDVAALEDLAKELGVDAKKLEASIRAATPCGQEDFGGRSCLLPTGHDEKLLHDGRPGASKAPAAIPTKAKVKPAKKATKKKAA